MREPFLRLQCVVLLRYLCEGVSALNAELCLRRAGDGMQETVARERRKQGGRYPVELEFPRGDYPSARLPPVPVSYASR